ALASTARARSKSKKSADAPRAAKGGARVAQAGQNTGQSTRQSTARRAGSRRSAEAQLAELKRRLREASDIAHAGAVLGWEQATYRPKGGALARGRQTAILGRLAHERFTDPAVGRLLDGLVAYAEGLPEDSEDGALIRVARREYDKAARVPAEFVARRNET